MSGGLGEGEGEDGVERDWGVEERDGVSWGRSVEGRGRSVGRGEEEEEMWGVMTHLLHQHDRHAVVVGEGGGCWIWVRRRDLSTSGDMLWYSVWDWERFVVLILGNFYIGGEERCVLKIIMFGW